MRHWNTADEATNANLRTIENLAHRWPGIDADRLLDVVRGVIRTEEMLPRAVRQHFKLPSLYVRDLPYDWSEERRTAWHEALCDALDAGLSAVAADPTLAKGGGADLSDRPATRAEEIEDACGTYSRDRTSTNLDSLRIACDVPGMYRRFEKLQHWLGRKRPGPSGQSLAYEVECALGDIRRYADDYHSMPASYRYEERLAARIKASSDD